MFSAGGEKVPIGHGVAKFGIGHIVSGERKAGNRDQGFALRDVPLAYFFVRQGCQLHVIERLFCHFQHRLIVVHGFIPPKLDILNALSHGQGTG